jgi:hypothetical protein
MAKKKKEMKKYLFKRGQEGNYCGMHKHGGGVYFLGFVGAAIYYIQNSVGFWAGALGVLKACVWPVFLIYKLLGM